MGGLNSDEMVKVLGSENWDGDRYGYGRGVWMALTLDSIRISDGRLRRYWMVMVGRIEKGKQREIKANIHVAIK